MLTRFRTSIFIGTVTCFHRNVHGVSKYVCRFENVSHCVCDLGSEWRYMYVYVCVKMLYMYVRACACARVRTYVRFRTVIISQCKDALSKKNILKEIRNTKYEIEYVFYAFVRACVHVYVCIYVCVCMYACWVGCGG